VLLLLLLVLLLLLLVLVLLVLVLLLLLLLLPLLLWPDDEVLIPKAVANTQHIDWRQNRLRKFRSIMRHNTEAFFLRFHSLPSCGWDSLRLVRSF
jgi:hypothetical protein